MADDKKNIPDAGKADKLPKPGNTEPLKTDPLVQDQPSTVGHGGFLIKEKSVKVI